MTLCNILEKTYNTTFTSEKKVEASKECIECKKFQPATKFRGSKEIRKGVKGTARRLKCRKCEDHRIAEEKNKSFYRTEMAVDSLTHDIEKIKRDSLKAIKILREDLDYNFSENRKLKREVEDLRIKIDEIQSSKRSKPVSIEEAAQR